MYRGGTHDILSRYGFVASWINGLFGRSNCNASGLGDSSEGHGATRQ